MALLNTCYGDILNKYRPDHINFQFKMFTPGDSTVFRMHAILLLDMNASRIANETFHFEKPLPFLLVVYRYEMQESFPVAL